jgi:hypothetical protein
MPAVISLGSASLASCFEAIKVSAMADVMCPHATVLSGFVAGLFDREGAREPLDGRFRRTIAGPSGHAGLRGH